MNVILIPKTTGMFYPFLIFARKAARPTKALVTVNLERVIDLIQKKVIKKVLIFSGAKSYVQGRIIWSYEVYNILRSLNKKIKIVLIDDKNWPVPDLIQIPDLNIVEKMKQALL